MPSDDFQCPRQLPWPGTGNRVVERQRQVSLRGQIEAFLDMPMA